MASWTNLPPFRVLTATSVARMDQLLDNITVLASHSHTGSGGDGASVIGVLAIGTCPCESAPQVEFHIIPFLPDNFSNWSRVSPCPIYPDGAAIKTDAGVSASGASIGWSILLPGSPLSNASWTLLLGYLVGSNSGCIAACIGGSRFKTGAGVSTLDFYNATDNTASSNSLAASGVSASGIYTLRIQVVGQNVSSSGFQAGITHIGFTYT